MSFFCPLLLAMSLIVFCCTFFQTKGDSEFRGKLERQEDLHLVECPLHCSSLLPRAHVLPPHFHGIFTRFLLLVCFFF